MTLVARIKELAAEKGLTIAELERILGFGNNVISKWDKSIPRSDKLERLADYFNVSTDYLLGRTIFSSKEYHTCMECGLSYNPTDPDDIEEHIRYHKKYLAAVNKFGNAVLDTEKRTLVQTNAYRVQHSPTATLEEQYGAFFDLCTHRFTRSLAVNDWSLNHVDFPTYVAMLLHQKIIKDSLPPKVYNLAVEEYGTLPGLDNGRTIYEALLQAIDDNNTVLEKYRLLDEHGKNVVNAIIELELKRIQEIQQ